MVLTYFMNGKPCVQLLCVGMVMVEILLVFIFIDHCLLHQKGLILEMPWWLWDFLLRHSSWPPEGAWASESRCSSTSSADLLESAPPERMNIGIIGRTTLGTNGGSEAPTFFEPKNLKTASPTSGTMVHWLKDPLHHSNHLKFTVRLSNMHLFTRVLPRQPYCGHIKLHWKFKSRLEGEERLHLASFYADSRSSSPPGHQIRSHCDVKSRTGKEGSIVYLNRNSSKPPVHMFTPVSQIIMLTATTQMLQEFVRWLVSGLL